MKQVRIGILLSIIVSSIFVTCYGGRIPYRIFQCTLLVPVICFGYTLYVYERFRIYQRVHHKTLVKEEPEEYLLEVGNEDVITYEHIKLNFFEENSVVLGVEPIRECYLLPGEKKNYKTSVLCRYRGNYAIGVKSVQVTDFIHLFTITYPIKEPYEVTVLPKITVLEKCFFLEESLDEKQGSCFCQSEVKEMDMEIRPYIHGDELRFIHWKATAKYGELFTRKQMNKAKQGVGIYLELIEEEGEHRLAKEDRMLETALSIAYYCVKNDTKCSMVYEQGEIKTFSISGLREFEQFYQNTAQLFFRGKMSTSQLLESFVPAQDQIVILFSLALREEILECAAVLANKNQKVTVIVAGEEPSDWEAGCFGFLVIFLPFDSDIKKLLEEGVLL
ncbi:DUF58 domain-containing protein [[Clostridium] polysaccharolyticum]|uniref:DUF58 domain-containing protein n=1 Tax=[Clostridium] polysaccharolyticum TaxID=29364 RepID=A0A1I0FNX3_9FIRM|nr:DUF58 domain-containing protein [[Clostridium] polysaccharolyticum]SET59213.1 Protein of unknown function DUF58 [[Clostridium] polysaccharolyticum]